MLTNINRIVYEGKHQLSGLLLLNYKGPTKISLKHYEISLISDYLGCEIVKYDL